ncbi:MAG TPA: VCBS repeat-containing protein, partial [Chryseolinea sp.]|nr:VCBS repeat-containing protein [Chryseolinea sp.]
MPASKTNIDFENVPEKRELLSILYYLYYYNGGGVATGDINNDGLTDLYFTANSNGHNKLYLNKGNFEFEDITTKAGVAGSSDWCTGVTMADVNGDGFLDIYVSAFSKAHGLEGRNELFINNKDNSFTESAIEYGLDFSGFSTQAAFFDYDHDGDLDCYLLNQSQKPNQNIVDTSNRRKINVDEGDKMYRNELITANDRGSKKFTNVSKTANIYQSNLGYGLGLSIADFNNDGWDDVYVGNDFHENDYYYINKGDGSFSEEGVKHFNHYSRFSMGNDAADYNNDGQLDLVTVDMLPDNEKVLKTYGSDENADIYKLKLIKNGFQYQVSRNTLQRNNGDGRTFSDEALLAGMYATDWSWSPLFADFDNDGNKDLFISSGIVKRPVDLDYIRFASDLYTKKQFNKTNKYDEVALAAMPDGSSHPFLFKGNGDARFQDFSKTWGTGEMKGYYNGAAYADLDNDGRLDLVINALNQEAVVLQNNLPKQNSLSISFVGRNANTKGIGAKAYVFNGDSMQYQQLMLTRGFMSSSDARLHFGLNQHTVVDSILVVWPDQQYQVLKNVPVNKPLIVDQKNAASNFSYGDFFKPSSEAMTRENKLVNWRHRENVFEDFNNQYLIPHSESTRGPKIATADVNKDGLEDFYECGAKDQAGALLIAQKNGSYLSADTAVFDKAKTSEEVDALFVDANNDDHPDLYVVSGGNEYNGPNPALLDKLYLNDGKGRFLPTENALPQVFENKSCVTAGDIDKDG